jgi:hypothetical protein
MDTHHNPPEDGHDGCLPEPDPIHTEKRRTARRSLVPEEAACACGHADPSGLTLQDDHVLGVGASDAVRVWLCLNCHAQQTALRHDYQAGTRAGRQRPSTSFPERLAMALRSLAVFLHSLSRWLMVHAEGLLEMVRGLDRRDPSWRDEGWAL